MRPLPFVLMPALLSAAMMATAPAAAGTAEVRYENPDRFSDAGRGRAAEATQKALTGILQALAERGLPASQVLTVEVTDVDLAGEIPPGSVRLHDVRVLGRHADWPRISLRYTLKDGDRTLAQGSDVVSDMTYLERGGMLASRGELPYERRMLGEWFSRRFAPAAAH